MTQFSGFGPGKKGGPRRLVYDLTGSGRTGAQKKRRDPARFQPFTSNQFSKHDCDAVGVPRDKDGSAVFTHERQLNAMQAHMKRTGRYLEWKQH